MASIAFIRRGRAGHSAYCVGDITFNSTTGEVVSPSLLGFGTTIDSLVANPTSTGIQVAWTPSTGVLKAVSGTPGTQTCRVYATGY